MTTLEDIVFQDITDEKLADYLAIWKRHVEQNRKEKLEFTLDFFFRFEDPLHPVTLTFGEEKRVLTWEQTWRLYETFLPLVEKYGKKT